MNSNFSYTYIDLFCGAGGMSMGFDKAGFSNVFSLDIEPNFCKTYKFNFPDHLLIEKDIKNVTISEIESIIPSNGVDVIIGGPPCQGFSIAGNIGRKFIEDQRNNLFIEYARIVEVVRPKYFVMENVARLFSHNKGKTKDEILTIFKSLGYNVRCEILNSADFGIPQIRNRAVFIGNRISDKIKFPDRIVKNRKTVKEVISRFPPLASGEKSDIANHIAMKHTDQMLLKMQYVSDGGNRYEIPENLRPKTGDVRKYIRYKSNEPSICITGDMRKVFHYDQNRALTVRELAAIQTFPDSFVFKGSVISQQQQVGNAVPPMLAHILADSIIEMIKNDK